MAPAGVMNFVIFPAFFLSSALYPLWQLRESSELIYWISVFNPFTHLIEIIRFGMHGIAMTPAGWITLAVLVVITPAAGYLFRPEAQ